MKIVICGGGVIGTSCAYFLAKKNISVTIIEQEEIACGASGKAGGFLCKTWCQTNSCDDLARLSYKLHLDLSKEFTDVGYRNVNTYSVSVDKKRSSTSNVKKPLNWINDSVSSCSLMETTENTSQVHPQKLSQRLLKEAKSLTQNATQVILDTVIGIEFDSSKSLPSVKSIKLKSGKVIEADKVLIAMGPWSFKAMDWFPKGSIPKISGHRAHSIVLKVPENVDIPADCLFLEYETSHGTTHPEIYPRPDGTVYACGFGEDMEVPDKASEVKVEANKCNQLVEMVNSTCSKLHSSEVLAQQACYLPLSPDGVPVIGRINHVEGGYIATGHSCWGILNSTGTGYAMAELIATGECKSLNLKPFEPGRFK